MMRNVTAAAAAAILMFLTGVHAQHIVTFPHQSICAVTGSSIKVSCTVTIPYHSRVTQREWYRVQRSEEEPQDLSKDPQYTGRVFDWKDDCGLTVMNVSSSDSGVYNFRFRTQSSDWISTPSGVHLTVTDLQVKVDPNTVGQKAVKVICSATCSFSIYQFYWYRNGHDVQVTEGNSIVLDSTRLHDEGSYSCKVYESPHRSPPVCVLGRECWSVTYTPDRVCVLKDTSFDLSCSYKHPVGHKVIKSMWFVKQKADGEGVDVRDDEEYQGRVQYTRNNCSMRIRNLTETDARIYTFRLDTDGGDYTGEPGVSLSITDLTVTVSDRSEQNMTLSCNTTCTLSNDPTYIWYKNGERVSECKSASCSVTAVGGDVTYSCAVKGRDEIRSPPVYSPKNTRAAVLPSGLPVKGDSVTLSCSSDANPPVLTFSWFKQRAATDTLLTQEQNYSISNISSQDSGLYYCTATNQLGRHNSTPVHLDMTGSEENTILTFCVVGLVVLLAVTLLPAALWMLKRKWSSAHRHSSTPESEQLRSEPVYGDVAASNHRQTRVVPDDQENVTYASVVFNPSHAQIDEDDVQYAAVKIRRSSAAPQRVKEEAADDSSLIYSKIQHIPPKKQKLRQM